MPGGVAGRVGTLSRRVAVSSLPASRSIRASSSSYEHQARLLGLSTAERDEILAVLVDCPDGLGELRAVLVQQHEWRRCEGLSA